MTNEQNNVNYEMADSVLAKVVKLAALEVSGIAGISEYLGGLLGKKSQGITVKKDEHGLVVDLHVIVHYGGNVREIARQVQLAVAAAVQKMIDPEVLTVNVFVEDITQK